MLICPLLINAQKEVKTFYDPDEKELVKEVYFVRNDDPAIRVGEYKKYHVSGNLMMKGVFEDGFKDGIFEEYYESGALQRAIKYTLGERTGKVSIYDKEGNIIQTAFYENNELSDSLYTYYSTGELKSKGKYAVLGCNSIGFRRKL